MELKKYRNKAGMRKPQEPYPHYGTIPDPSLASNAMHLHPSSSLCYSHNKAELEMQVHCVGGQRGDRHRSIVGGRVL